jgi:hypothetical protein
MPSDRLILRLRSTAIAAAGFWLAAVPAATAQNYQFWSDVAAPFAVPANSFLGRASVPSDAGRLTVLPFGVLSNFLAQSGTVMSPPATATQGHLATFGGAPNLLIDSTMSAALDGMTGSVQGSIMYRSAAVWVALAPGTSGQLLSSGGPSGNPLWITASGTDTVTSVGCGAGLSGGTITASGTCAVNYAAKSDQQTGNSNILAVTPLHQQDHDSAAKAWVNFSGSNGTTNASYNVTGNVTRNGTGNYTVIWTTQWANANYVCHVGGNGTQGFAYITGQSTASMTWQFVNASGVGTDPSQGEVVCFGRQ